MVRVVITLDPNSGTYRVECWEMIDGNWLHNHTMHYDTHMEVLNKMDVWLHAGTDWIDDD